MEGTAPIVELTTSMDDIHEGGTNTESTTEVIAPITELITNMDSIQGGGTNTESTAEGTTSSEKLTTDMDNMQEKSLKLKPTTEMVQSQGRGTNADNKADNLLMLSNSALPYIIPSNQASSIINELVRALFPEPDREHKSTTNASIIIDDSTGESSKLQTPVKKRTQILLFQISNYPTLMQDKVHFYTQLWQK
eukprot:3290961-Ditylum_brightwellii.AAC.1